MPGTLAGSTALLTLTRVLNIVLGVLLIPLLLHFLGGDGFASWAILLSWASILGQLEAGVPIALVKQMAVPAARGEKVEVGRLLSTAMGFGLAVYQALASSETLSGGRSGLRVPPMDFPDGVPASVGLYYVDLALLIGFVVAAGNLVSSYVGRAWVAIRDAELAAAAAGVNPTRYKLLAFAVSSFYTGVHGALLAQFLGHLEPQSFTVSESIALLAAVIVGGAASVAGALLGAAFVTLLPTLAGERGFFVPVSLGLAMILVVRFEPEGLAGLLRTLKRRFEPGVLR